MYILKNKITKPRLQKKDSYLDTPGNIKHYPPANREWFDSIYTYNKNTIKLLPVASSFIVKLIKSYFNFYSVNLERTIKLPKIRKWKRRLSNARILISKAELKHTNNKVIVTIYVYNGQEKYYLNKLKKLSTLLELKRLKIKLKFHHVKMIFNKFTGFLDSKKNELINNLHINKTIFNSYENNNLSSYIRKSLNREISYIYILQSMLVNRFKFKNFYLSRLNNILTHIYNKKIEFNFVNQKYFYLNSDILLQILAIKLRKRKNVVKVLRTAMDSVDRFNLTKLQILRGASIKYLLEHNHNKHSQNIKITNDLINNNTDTINNKLKQYIIFNKKKLNFFDLNQKKKIIPLLGLEHAVINSLKYKNLSGIRLEASGRLTRRMIAARSVYKVIYDGNIRNLDSSTLKHSATILRGNLRSSIQYSNLKSKNRLGSFGLKGWINGI